MTLHIYATRGQPATCFTDPSMPGLPAFRYSPRTPIRCHHCGRRRWASKLVAYVYYDGVNFFCREKELYRGRTICKGSRKARKELEGK